MLRFDHKIMLPSLNTSLVRVVVVVVAVQDPTIDPKRTSHS